MIDMVKNRERLEQEKRKFEGRGSYEKYEKNFKQLLDSMENDPEFKVLIEEYRKADVWLTRYDMKRVNTNKKSLTDEEAKRAIGIMLHETEAYELKCIELKEEILKRHYKGILKQEA